MPQLDDLFKRLVAERAPLVDFAQNPEWDDGIIEPGSDTEADYVRTHDCNGPYLVPLHGSDHMPGFETLELEVLTSRRVHRSEAEAIVARVVETLLSNRPR